MNKHISTIIFICLAFNSMNAQHTNQFNPNLNFKKLNFDYKISSSYQEYYQINKNTEICRDINIPDCQEKKININQNLNEFHSIAQRFDKMPIFVPKGNYPIIIIRPDSAIQYSMLVIKP